MGRPIMTHEMFAIRNEIRAKSMDDFLALCAEQKPCEDAVSRQAILEMIEQIQDAGGFIGYNTYSEAFDRVDNMPSVTPTQKWIPTSEHQPKENGNYLAFYRTSDGTASLDFMMVDHCNAGGGWLHEESKKKSYKKVMAWMPLPETYREREEKRR